MVMLMLILMLMLMLVAMMMCLGASSVVCGRWAVSYGLSVVSCELWVVGRLL